VKKLFKSTNHLGTAAIVVSAGVIISRVLGQLREVIFAQLLGASQVTDQYVAAFRIPDFMNYLLAGGFLSITFIPIFSRYLADDDEDGGWDALTAIIRPLVAAIVALTVVGWLLAPSIISKLYPEFTPIQIANTIRLTRIVLPAQIFFVTGALFSAVQYAKGVFWIPTLAPIIYNVSIISGGVLFAVITGNPDPEGFIWGALIGAAIGNFAVQWWGARRVGMHLNARLPWSHPVLKEYAVIALPLMLGQSIVVLDETFMSAFGDLVGDGAQTRLQYARRTMLVPVGAIAQAASVAAYPTLARLFAEGKQRALAATVDKAISWVVVLSILSAGLIAGLAEPIMRTQFERGSFTNADSIAAGTALFFYAFSIPMWGVLQIITRSFYARRQMWVPVAVGTVSTVVAIPIYVMFRAEFGLAGVAVASVVSIGIYTSALAYLWYSDDGHQGRVRRVADSAGRAIPPTVIGGAAAFVIARVVMSAVGGWNGSALALVVGAGVYVAVGLGTLLGIGIFTKASPATADYAS
jgi:putative peptidoglycan lipid II flippase